MNLKHTFQTYPVLSSLSGTVGATFLWCLILFPTPAVPEVLAVTVLVGLFCFYPFVLTALNLGF